MCILLCMLLFNPKTLQTRNFKSHNPINPKVKLPADPKGMKHCIYVTAPGWTDAGLLPSTQEAPAGGSRRACWGLGFRV